jgi:hypothetical protein
MRACSRQIAMRLECGPYMRHPPITARDLRKSEPLSRIRDVCASTSLYDFGCNCPTCVSCLQRSLRLPVVMVPRVFNTNELKHVEVIDDRACVLVIDSG